MPKTEVIWLPVPRAVVASCSRTRRGSAETLAVIDDMPFEIPFLTDGEAPVAVLSRATQVSREVRWRAHGGALWRDLRTFPADGTPASVAAALAARAARHVESPRERTTRYGDERVFPYIETYARVGHARGLRRLADHPVREVHDDGREAQAAVHAEVSRNLLLVDGLLCHRAPAPYAAVSALSGYDIVSARPGTPDLDPWSPAGDSRSREPWAAFPLGSETLGAYAEGLLARRAAGRPGRATLNLDGMEVLDRAAYEAAYGPGAAGLLARCWGSFSECVAPWLKDMPDGPVGEYVAARAAMSSAVDDASVADACPAVLDAMDALASALRDVPSAGRAGETAAGRAADIRLRFEACEMPALVPGGPAPR